MPKIKTKAGAKKRFRMTGGGKVRANFGCKRHNLRKRPQKMKRKARGTFILAPEAQTLVKRYFPYGG
jgi:large subunit ribosomal protein L35